MGCFIDLTEKTISFSKNGRYFDIAFDIPNKFIGEAFYVACTLKNSSLTYNFGEAPFKHPPGFGYKPIGKADASQLVAGAVKEGKKRSGPMAIILEPSRELAEQTDNQIRMFKKYLPEPGLKSAVFIGKIIHYYIEVLIDLWFIEIIVSLELELIIWLSFSNKDG